MAAYWDYHHLWQSVAAMLVVERVRRSKDCYFEVSGQSHRAMNLQWKIMSCYETILLRLADSW